MSQPNRLFADAAHEFGGIALDRSKPLSFTLNGRRIDGYFGDTVLSAALAPRSFSTEHGTKTFAKGALIGCYSCHNGPNP